jgi:hypothetical protein
MFAKFDPDQAEAADEIERLRDALEYLLSEVERSSADVDPRAVRDSRTALRQAVDFEDRWDNA